MNTKRLRRVVAFVGVASLVALQLFSATASAAPPRWRMTVDLLPPTVQNGENAGFRVTIYNDGPSNISSLYLVNSLTAATTYVSDLTHCSPAGTLLYCSFGALNAGENVTVTVAYLMGSSYLSVVFEGNTGGATYSDKNKRSHGDTLYVPDTSEYPDYPAVVTTSSSSRNFAGGFNITTGVAVVADDQKLHPSKNKQATTVAPPASAVYVPVTVQDGITTDLSGGACTGGFGEWSVVNVNYGETYGTAFKVTITVVGNSVPNDFDPATVVVCHVNDDGSVNWIGAYMVSDVLINDPTERCDDADAPTNVAGEGCVFSEFVGSTLRTTLWVFQNGSYRH